MQMVVNHKLAINGSANQISDLMCAQIPSSGVKASCGFLCFMQRGVSYWMALLDESFRFERASLCSTSNAAIPDALITTSPEMGNGRTRIHTHTLPHTRTQRHARLERPYNHKRAHDEIASPFRHTHLLLKILFGIFWVGRVRNRFWQRKQSEFIKSNREAERETGREEKTDAPMQRD